MSRRTDRIADQIRAELAQLLLTEVRDHRVKLASVASVRVTSDLSQAYVGVSVLSQDEDERLRAVEGLEHARGFLRSHLARRLDLRLTPELHFELDRGAEHSQRISDLLESLHVDDEQSS